MLIPSQESRIGAGAAYRVARIVKDRATGPQVVPKEGNAPDTGPAPGRATVKRE